MASALWLGSMEPQWLAPFLSLPVQVMVTPEMMVPVLPGQRFFTPSDDRETTAAGSYIHLRATQTVANFVCRLLL